MSHAQKNEMATKLVSNFAFLSLGSRNDTLQQEEKIKKLKMGLYPYLN